MIIALAFDEGPGIGLGHRRRGRRPRPARCDALGVRRRAARRSDRRRVSPATSCSSTRTACAPTTATACAADTVDRDRRHRARPRGRPRDRSRPRRRRAACTRAAERVLAGAPYALVDPDAARRCRTAPLARRRARGCSSRRAAPTPTGVGARVATELADALPGRADPPRRRAVGPGVATTRASTRCTRPTGSRPSWRPPTSS